MHDLRGEFHDTLFFWKAGDRRNELLLEPRSVKQRETEDEFVGRFQKNLGKTKDELRQIVAKL